MDAVVIGAGHAGLAVSQQLAEADVEHVVLERGHVGESWRNMRWDTFTLNTPSWMNRMPGDSDSDVIDPPDGFPTNGALVDRLDAYRRRWRLPVREGVTVTRVEAKPDSSGFLVHVSGEMDRPITCASVVVASGIQNVTRTPPIAAAFPDSVTQVPALDYKRPDQLPAGAVLVVGGGQTGAQVVEDLLEDGRTVHWSVSKVTRIPRRYRGREILEWLIDAGFYAQLTEQIEDPAALRAAIGIVSGVGRYGHTVSLQWLAQRGAKLLGRITSVDGDVLELDDSVADCIRFGDRRSAGIHKLIDDHIDARGLALPPTVPDEADEPLPDPGSVHSPGRIDLPASNITSVVWATGVTGDFGYLPEEAVARDGSPIHDKGSAVLDGLYFVGLPWLTSRASGIIHGIVTDAGAIAARVRERATEEEVLDKLA